MPTSCFCPVGTEHGLCSPYGTAWRGVPFLGYQYPVPTAQYPFLNGREARRVAYGLLFACSARNYMWVGTHAYQLFLSRRD
jgi:hypothetical protein